MKKKVSIRDVANLASVSPGTVSNFLNSSAPVNKETQERIQHAIKTLGYRRNHIASSLRRAQTNTLGLILPDIRNPFYAEFYYSVEHEAMLQNYNIIFGNFDYDGEKLNRYIDIFASRRVDGIIASTNYTFQLEKQIQPIEIPLVLIEPSRVKHLYPTVGIDNIEGSFKMVEFLINKGHKDIAIITSSTKSTRFMGYEKALLENGIRLKKNLILEAGRFSVNLFNQGFEAMNQLLEQGKFSACFVISDMLAIGAMSACKKRNLRVPDDIAVCGFDNIPMSEIVDPPLTTVYQPIAEMGKAAVNKILELIESKSPINTVNDIIFETKILNRKSV